MRTVLPHILVMAITVLVLLLSANLFIDDYVKQCSFVLTFLDLEAMY